MHHDLVCEKEEEKGKIKKAKIWGIRNAFVPRSWHSVHSSHNFYKAKDKKRKFKFKYKSSTVLVRKIGVGVRNLVLKRIQGDYCPWRTTELPLGTVPPHPGHVMQLSGYQRVVFSKDSVKTHVFLEDWVQMLVIISKGWKLWKESLNWQRMDFF